jgi:hypothetical protein
MKRFIIISLLSVLSMPMLACLWVETYNYYLFKVYDVSDFSSRTDEITRSNWKAYLGLPEDNYFYFNAEEVIKAAKQKGDALMVSYAQNLQKYLDCVNVEQRKQYEWNYPTKEDLDGQKRDLQAIRTYALGKSKSKLRSQHALLYMRCNMMLGNHQENITFWEQTASQFIETVYKDMMKNIYAGALYKTGKEAEAGELFAEMGDYNSLMTQFYKKRSYQAIRQHYMQNPQSKALPFLLQDFVNNTQEAVDIAGEGCELGKQFVRDITKEEAWQMQQFCEMVVREGKTDAPIMWKSAKAWIEYLYGDKKQAAKDIVDATSLDGTPRMKDCARELMLYITAAQAKTGDAFDDYLADEMQWLNGRDDEQATRVMKRLTEQLLVNRYADSPERLAAILKVTHNYNNYYIDTLGVNQLEKYLFYTNTPAKNALDKFLKAHVNENDTVLSELIGTKYMRLCQWDKAIQWLKDIPVSFYNDYCTNEYRYYSIRRSYEVEPWITRQWLSGSEAWEKDFKWWKHIKLDFCKEMQMMEGSVNLLKGKALEQRYYNMAVRYAQASIHGDCWWLLRYYKSANDTVRVNEVDLGQKAIDMLQNVAMSSDPALKKKALFALTYRDLYGVIPYYRDTNGKLWREKVWDSQKSDYVDIINASSPQYRAYQALYDLVGDQPQEDYIRKCDEYDQFKNYYRQNKK